MEGRILSEFYVITFFLQNLFLAILMLISRKLVQRRGIGEKCVFSLLAGREQRVKSKVDCVRNIFLKISHESFAFGLG